MQNTFSTIICIADVNITDLLDKTLSDLALPEVFVQRAKQMFLVDKRGFLGLRPVTKHDESRALFYHFYVPPRFEHGVMRRIAEAADLRMGGRGSIFAQRGVVRRGSPLHFDEAKLEALCGSDDTFPVEDYACICCTVSRGAGESLAAAVLELGLCVPVVFFGSGVGLRDRLGLLRITVPVEKEIIWFLVLRSDAELVEKTLIPRARLDVPGHGFLYKSFVHAPVVNLRVRHGKRVHAATMEQVIAALDEVRGSSDWRRLGTKTDDFSESGNKAGADMRGLFFIGEEEEVEIFRKTAMENGARGATLNHLEMRSYRAAVQEQTKEFIPQESHSRELCDIIIPAGVEEGVMAHMEETGLFAAGKSCLLKTLPLAKPASFRYM